MRILSCLATSILIAATPAHADDFQDAMALFVTNEIKPWTSTDLIVGAVMQQNAETGTYGLGEILAADREWRTEVKQSEHPNIDAFLQEPASEYLASRVRSMGGIISEIIITDARGLNAAVSAPTSDMWQGDEPKFTQTFELETDAYYISEVEFDDSTNTFQCQISFRLLHPQTQLPIGVVTVGVNAERFL